MSTFEYFLDYLKTGNWKDRRMACERLGVLGDERALEPLIYALDDQDVSVRQAAAAALAELNHPGAASPIIEHLELERDEPVRLASIEALGKLRSSNAVKPLSSLLKDELVSIRLASCKALGDIRDARALRPLMGRLVDPYLEIRAMACESLGLLKKKSAVRPLIRMLGDPQPVVREKSLDALRRLEEYALVYAYSRALFGEKTDASALQELARNGDVRLITALMSRLENPLTKDDRKDRLEETIKALFKPSSKALDIMLCTAHLKRFSRQVREIENVGKISFTGCRECSSTLHVLPSLRVLVVLNKRMKAKKRFNKGVLRINWFHQNSLFDFNRIEIGEAEDKEVTQFCLMIANDTDPERPDKFNELVCDILPTSTINLNTLQILKRTFSHVRDLRGTK